MKTVNCISAGETGFAVGVPLTVSPSIPSHKDSVIKALRVESNCFMGSNVQRKAMDGMILFLESPQDQEAMS